MELVEAELLGPGTWVRFNFLHDYFERLVGLGVEGCDRLLCMNQTMHGDGLLQARVVSPLFPRRFLPPIHQPT